MSQIDPQNCWEYWNCDPEHRKTCLAFTTNSGTYCWDLVGSIAKSATCPELRANFKDCLECSWFKIKNPEFANK